MKLLGLDTGDFEIYYTLPGELFAKQSSDQKVLGKPNYLVLLIRVMILLVRGKQSKWNRRVQNEKHFMVEGKYLFPRLCL